MADGLRIEVKGDFEQARKAFARLSPEALAKAGQAALNKTGTQARSEASVEIARVFDRPTPYTLAAPQARFGKPSELRTEVTLRNLHPGQSVSQHIFLGPEIAGGQRQDKRSEAALRGAGLLPSGWQTAPGPAAKLDQYGNMSRGDVVRILSYLKTFTGERAKYNTGEARRARLFKGTRKRAGFELFVSLPGEHWPSGRPRAPGVWQRTYRALGTSVDLLLTFIRPPAYKPRLPFPQIVDRVVKRDFSGNLADALSKAPTA